MWKPVVTSTVLLAFGLATWLLLPLSAEQAAAQSGPLLVNLVELDIVPAEMDKYMAEIKENGANAVKEPGCRMFNITVSTTEPNHVLLFEAYNNAAALDAHRATDHFKKYQAATANMVAKRNVRVFSGVALNTKPM